MAKINLYYTVEKESTTDITGEAVLNGDKTLRLYKIKDNKPYLVCEIKTIVECSSTGEIQLWLNDNGYTNKEFNFEEL
jgi:hypothetical protein